MEAIAGISKKTAVLLALIVSLSFALGFVWGYGNSVAPIVIEKCANA